MRAQAERLSEKKQQHQEELNQQNCKMFQAKGRAKHKTVVYLFAILLVTDYSFFENLKYENHNSYLGLCLELEL